MAENSIFVVFDFNKTTASRFFRLRNTFKECFLSSFLINVLFDR